MTPKNDEKKWSKNSSRIPVKILDFFTSKMTKKGARLSILPQKPLKRTKIPQNPKNPSKSGQNDQKERENRTQI